MPLQWRHNGRDVVSNHQPHDSLLNLLLGRRPKKTSKLRVTGLCAGNSRVTGEFPARMANIAENVSIWWRHPDFDYKAVKIDSSWNGLVYALVKMHHRCVPPVNKPWFKSLGKMWALEYVTFNTLRPRQNGHHLSDDIFKCSSLCIKIIVSWLKFHSFFPNNPIDNKAAYLWMFAWRLAHPTWNRGCNYLPMTISVNIS